MLVVAHRRSYDEARRRELADFLRKRRQGLAPPRAVSSHRRRLTPGLRREEVAELAGVGTTWYTWLEQARDIRPSERTVRRIARALQLSKTETQYLIDLALEHTPRPGRGQVPRELLTVVNAMSIPAWVIGRSCERLAYNLPANALYDLDYAPESNFLRSLFTPAMRAFIVNWRDFTRQMVAVFRKRSACVLGDAAVAELVDDLIRWSPEFHEWWAEQVIAEANTHDFVCKHPFVGRLDFAYSCFGVVEQPDLVAVALATERESTRRRLADLIRQVEHDEHDADRNLWTALGWPRSAPAHDHHSQYR
jgi:transcriptional regulator with XRE-family HTH domain